MIWIMLPFAILGLYFTVILLIGSVCRWEEKMIMEE